MTPKPTRCIHLIIGSTRWRLHSLSRSPRSLTKHQRGDAGSAQRPCAHRLRSVTTSGGQLVGRCRQIYVGLCPGRIANRPSQQRLRPLRSHTAEQCATDEGHCLPSDSTSMSTIQSGSCTTKQDNFTFLGRPQFIARCYRRKGSSFYSSMGSC